jgi:hypothetical protein
MHPARILWLALLSCTSFALFAADSGKNLLAPERVRAAMEWGRSASEDDLRQYEIKTAADWRADFDTAYLRVAQLAGTSQRHAKELAPSDIPDSYLADEVHVYVHARQDNPTAPLPSFEYLMLARPAAQGRMELVLPTSFERFVRQVPIPGYYGPARLAHSVRAAFPSTALVAGSELRIVMQGGAIMSTTIEAKQLARVR